MADFNKLKDTIRGAIYPNGRGAISADKHQAALLDMADTMQETATQVTELSEETEKTNARNGITIPFKDGAYQATQLDTPLIKGMVITDIGNAVSAVIGATGYDEIITKAKLPFVIHTPITYIYSNSANSGEMRVEGFLWEVEHDLDGLSAEVDAERAYIRNGITIPFKTNAFDATQLDTPLVKGMVITSIGDVANYVQVIGANYEMRVTNAMLPFTISETITSVYADLPNSGEMRVEGILYGLENELDGLSAEVDVERAYVRNGIAIPFKTNAFDAAQLDTPLVKGMVITSIGDVANYVQVIGTNYEQRVTNAMLPFTISETITSVYADLPNSGEMRVEGILFGLENGLDVLDAKVETEKAYVREGITIPFKNEAYQATQLDTPLVKGMVITDIGNAVSAVIGATGYDEIITKAKLPFVVHTPITYIYSNSANSGEMRVEGMLYGLENGLDVLDVKVDSIQNTILDKGETYISMPIPQIAKVNIRANALPTKKTDNIHAELDFDNLCGKKFTKNIIINAQGTSSLGLAKKNFSIDIVGDNYEDSHEIKFGDWVSQDGFHLKGYMLDGIRVKPLAAYDVYENILTTRGLRKDRAWKRLQLPSDIPVSANNIEDAYMQIDDGAKNHPSGFPIIVYFNNEFYGIYCWQLKKHRKNYHQEKKNSKHIHLDGNISNALLWESNGVINWNKWSGKETETENSPNREGIEIRNPKPLLLTDGTEYDGETNRGELISKDSSNYDSSNANMKRTAEVRESLELLSSNVARLSAMAVGEEKKKAIADVFDVDSIIDYIIFSQLLGNKDGYNKNWQWVTYDGIKWAVNAYDLDGTWGWTSWDYYEPLNYWFGVGTPPIGLIIENYLDEVKVRYAELRRGGTISLEKIMQPLANYVRVVGIDYYEQEFEKWADGGRDNLWRFESWMEESIKRTDALMGYNS